MAHKTYQSIKHLGLRTSVAAVASCLVLAGAPQLAYAAGLGRIVVYSGLGQPLRAEIEVSASREELTDMKAQLASPETFKQAGLDYATTLLSIRFNLEKRPNGQAVIKVSSDKPIHDPFVDMLLELNWPSGRLVREYTFLLDPPEYSAKSAPAAVPAPAVVTKPTVAAPPSQRIDAGVRARASAQARTPAQTPDTPKAAEPEAAPAGEGRVVRRGDTLNRIAGETKYEGVSLEQMLVGLFRANPGAFEGGNMNRLRSGAILTVPDKAAVESLSAGEARKVIVAQSSDWNAYRSKLAGAAAKAPVAEDSGKQESGGKITAKVENKAESVQPKDQLKVSRTEVPGKKDGVGAGKPSDDDQVAKDKVLKDANERVAALEKNVADLNKVIELQNSRNLAEMQKQASAKPEPAPTPKPAEPPAKPVEATPPPAPPAPPAEPAATKPEPVPAVEKSAEAAPAPVAEKPVEVKPTEPVVEKPKAVPPPAPVVEEPGFFEGLLSNPMALGGGVGIVALLGGYLFMRRRREAEAAVEPELTTTLTPPSTTGLTANSVFRSTGGQSVDTSSQTPAQTDFSQAGPGSIDTDEVDPVAEADVYMAYGRDVQAEEILLEARQKDPARTAIAVKLLEIYSGRKDLTKFNALATQLNSDTGGAGADWDKAAVMGRVLDPDNPLYRSSGSAPASPTADAPEAAVEQEAVAPVFDLPPEVPVAPVSVEVAVASVEEPGELATLDFDLGEMEAKPEAVVPTPRAAQEVGVDAAAAPASETLPDLDFDIGTRITPVIDTLEVTNPEFRVPDLDFDLTSSNGVQVADAAEVKGDGEGVEFDVSLTESTFLGRSVPEVASVDLSAIDLDLSVPELDLSAGEPVSAESIAPFEKAQVSTAVNPDFGTEQMETQLTPPAFAEVQAATALNTDFATSQDATLVAPVAEAAVPELEISANEEVATKLDLAKAYEEMGDLEGARELLQEVVKEGDKAQREAAQALLSKIGG